MSPHPLVPNGASQRRGSLAVGCLAAASVAVIVWWCRRQRNPEDDMDFSWAAPAKVEATVEPKDATPAKVEAVAEPKDATPAKVEATPFKAVADHIEIASPAPLPPRSPVPKSSLSTASSFSKLPGREDTRRRVIAGATPPRSTRSFCDDLDHGRWGVYGLSVASSLAHFNVGEMSHPDKFVEWVVLTHRRTGSKVMICVEDLDPIAADLDADVFMARSLKPLLNAPGVKVVATVDAAHKVSNSIFSKYAELVFTNDGEECATVCMFCQVMGTLGFRIQLEDRSCRTDDALWNLFTDLVAGAEWDVEDIHWTPTAFVKHCVTDSEMECAFSVPVSSALIASCDPETQGTVDFSTKRAPQTTLCSITTNPIEERDVIVRALVDEGFLYLVTPSEELLPKLETLEKQLMLFKHASQVPFGKYMSVLASPIFVCPIPNTAEIETRIIEHRFGESLVTVLLRHRVTGEVCEFTVTITALDPEDVELDVTALIDKETEGLHGVTRWASKSNCDIVSAWGPRRSAPTKQHLVVDAVRFGAAEDEWVLIEWIFAGSDPSAEGSHIPAWLRAFHEHIVNFMKVKI